MHLLGYWEAKDWVFGQRQVRQPWQVLVVRVHVREREYERVGDSVQESARECARECARERVRERVCNRGSVKRC